MNTIGNTSSSRYIRKIDYRESTADYKISSKIEDGSNVLEIGTSSGYMSEFLTVEKKCKVTGIEYNKELFEEAKKFFVNGYNKDLNDITNWENEIENNQFDYIVCQDVLEHLLSPFEVISCLIPKLKMGGKLLVSIPNVSHNAILMEILKDDFTYEQSGSLDYTHFKFYTAKSFKKEANKIGLKVINHDITYLVPEDSSLNNSYSEHSIKEREVLFDHYNGHVFQNIFVLGRKEDYKDIKEELSQNKLPNYDEITIKYKDSSNKYYYHENEILLIELKQNTKLVKITPSIRIKKYNIDLKVNGEQINLNTYNFPCGTTLEYTPRYISTGTESIKLKGDFKKGDKIEIKVYNCQSALDEVINGKECFDSEIVKLKAEISEYKSISIASLDTLFLKNYLEDMDLEKICAKFNLKKEEALLKFIDLNIFIKEIVDFAREKEIKLNVVTSTLLTEDILKKLLKKYELEDLNIIKYEKLHELSNQNNIHIGSDIAKDIVNLKNMNMDSYLYKTPKSRVKNKEIFKVSNISENILRAIQINNIYCGLSFKYFEKLGMQEIAPIYFYFTNWLYNKTKEKDNLFFMSRDGYMPHKVYKKILENKKEKKDIKYIYASRKAFQIPGLATVGLEKTVKTFTEFNLQLNEKVTIADALKIATIDINQVTKELLQKYGFESVEDVITAVNTSNARNLLKYFEAQITSNLKTQLDLANKYLKQEGMYNYEDVNVVDIGWRGSVQNYIKKITNKKINGYYVGTMITEYKDIKNDMYGCFVDKYRPFKRAEFMVDNIMMMELVFTAPAPQLLGFKEEKNKIAPIFSTVTSSTANKSIDTFQNAALAIIEKFIEYQDYLQELSPDFALSLYKKFIKKINYQDVLEFKKLETNIGYGEKQRKYVHTTTIEELIEDEKKVYKMANFAFWKGAIYISNVDSMEEYENLLEEHKWKMKLDPISSSRYVRGLKVILRGAIKPNKK